MFLNKITKLKLLPSQRRFLPCQHLAFYSIEVNNPLFDKILIANRGEIACRIIQTTKKLGIKTVAVYSEADRKALHADEAYYIGPAPSALSYLNKEKILQVAQLTGAKGIHPGYGFLSENADFAEILEKNSISFIGPPSSAIRSMGSKSKSKEIMETANVPVVPGYHGANQDPEFLKKMAKQIGYPVLIKAVLGGGGKGMRVVNDDTEFFEKLEGAKREAMKSFSDDIVLIEKYIVDPRHVEVQVFADKLGNAVYLYERDCSIQRRHQKILEESPAPHLSENTRKILGEKAVAAAKAVNYVGAGTVEFIMDSKTQEFYFMEMNTRLQVEHPVTEMVTGTDLVEWQLEVAAGNKLPLNQNEIRKNGHAFEARIYAEDPKNGFLPDTGKLVYMSTPKTSSDVRVETGVRQGDDITLNYDPMIAKLIVHGKDRHTALRLLGVSLDNFKISGLQTNIDFLRKIISIPDLADGKVETGFISKHEKTLFETNVKVPRKSIIQGAFGVYYKHILQNNNNNFAKNSKTYNPWLVKDSFRLWDVSLPNYCVTIKLEEELYKIDFLPKMYQPGHFEVNFSKSSDKSIVDTSDLIVLEIDATNSSDLEGTKIHLKAEVDKCMLTSNIVLLNDSLTIFDNSGKVGMSVIDKNSEIIESFGPKNDEGSIRAPMSSNIVQVLVKPGQDVDVGTHLVIVEAMKMEHVIKSPKKGVIQSVKFKVGDLVAQGQELVSFTQE
ncbi:hypothetical protein BB561_005034 [Smittium simulii]|uniref:Methylcrotonoyl-CoA carboxylase subunit alpha, mitochondrial n=1 Tax=Smittium simulii TaxID=133385 RepID=A0A2T9YCI7_9FUNG|nr:hypothetical protein BB561_005034 [Smittium simulii]